MYDVATARSTKIADDVAVAVRGGAFLRGRTTCGRAYGGIGDP